MDKRLFYKAIGNDVAGLAHELGLSIRDIYIRIEDGRFTKRDWRIIKERYGLTDEQISEVLQDE